MVALSTTAKRKKTADMEESPPKRVTRARAKAIEDTKSIAKTTKIISAAAKAAAESKAKTTRRKAQAEDEREQEEASSAPASNPKPEPAKARGRPKKIVDSVAAEATVEKAQTGAKRRREKDLSIPGPTQLERPNTRARPQKETLAVTAEIQELAVKDDKTRNQTKSTRGRATTTISGSTRTTAPKHSTIKKRVTFEVESKKDKENIPALQEQMASAGPRPIGLRAKPVRKPVQTKRSTRGKDVITGEMKETGGKQPLSPKKVKQVAKTSSISSTGSEDELCGEKTPVRALSKSPVKPAMNVMRTGVKPISKLDFSAAAAPLSPTKPLSSSILTSPARRPPPSPFKHALKESPIGVMRSGVKPTSKLDFSAAAAPSSPTKTLASSILTSPARRPPPAPFKHALKESPIKFKLEESTAQPAFKSSKSPMKVSLLQSPARRPASSPTKTAAPISPGKLAISVPVVDTTTPARQFHSVKKPRFSPQKIISSPLRAARSPEQTVKVHKMSLAEQEEHAIATKLCLNNQSVVSKDATENTPYRLVAQSIPESSMKTPQPELMLQSPPTSPTESADEAEGDVVRASATEPHVESVVSTRSTTPSGPPPPSVVKAYDMSSMAWRSRSQDSDSEDELQSPQKHDTPTPLSYFNISTKDFGIRGASTPSVPNKTPKSMMMHTAANSEALTSTKSKSRTSEKSAVSMTPLAVQLSSWLAASPEKNTPVNEVRRPRGIFSPIGPALLSRPDQTLEESPVMSPMKSTFFEDEMAVRDEANEAESEDRLERGDENRMEIQLSQDSQDSEVYGDENAMPLDPELLRVEPKTQDFTLTCTPAKVFSKQSREIHTVSKVPLRPAAEDSPLKILRKRSKSLSGSIAADKGSQRASSAGILEAQEGTTAGTLPNEYLADEYGTLSRRTLAVPQSPGSGIWSIAGFPAMGNRRGADAEILKGAVVYVDVHTTEGADASGIFLELLAQMGARCVKQWTWNSRASFGGSFEGTSSGQPASSGSGHESTTPGSKVGITHVVFKDGGKRTLEKVRESNGVVLCVGVGWVLDCERENKWLDEADYAVDTSIIPRGGHRRRKSMEPRMLSNVNGNLIPAEPHAKPPLDLSPTKEFLTFSLPASRRDSFAIQHPASPSAPPQTPTTDADADAEHDLEDGCESAWGSPTTPYYLSRGAELVQQTCPPKQPQQLLFPLSGVIADQPDESVRRRLLLARRKSLQWAPKVGSPLGRAVSFGKEGAV
ncbi:Microcephalin-like [Lasallia pustulata]|uniref:Microcephalin-like n=1 Tax=Lasallia pustulata TaxID=136370 RepID=A0A1W5CSL8_9LECA|nr:Microcephalin-like [Lasallia pustulata]